MVYGITFTKKILVASAVFAVTSVAQAQSFMVDGVNYEVMDPVAKTAKVVATLEVSGHLTIPSVVSHNGVDYTVKKLDESAFAMNVTLSSIVLPESLEEIDDFAFYGCTSLVFVMIPDGVVKIGSRAFQNCKFPVVKLPKSLEELGDNVFLYCSKLQEIQIDQANRSFSVLNGVLFDKDFQELYKYPSNKEQATYTIPETVKVLRGGSFEGSYNLEQVLFPVGLERIKEAAFLNCGAIKEINLPEGLKSIETNAFASTFNMERISIPKSVESIEDYVFLYCSALREVQVAEGNTRYYTENNVLFDRQESKLMLYPPTKEGAYRVPQSTVTVAKGAFTNAESLTSVEFPSSLKEIESYAFHGCKELKTIVNHASQPQTLGTGVWGYVEVVSTILKVPKGSKVIYQNTPVWKNFVIQEDETLSISEQINKNEMIVYPNPTNGVFFIKNHQFQTGVLYDASGQVVRTIHLKQGENEVDISGQHSGVYWFNLAGKIIRILKK